MTIDMLSGSQKALLSEIVPKEYLTDEYVAICAFDKGYIVGTALYKETKERICDLAYIYVFPLHRKKGIGRELVLFFEDIARTMGISGVVLNYIDDAETGSLNGFLADCGFTEISSSYLYQVPLSLALDSVFTYKGMNQHKADRAKSLSELSNGEWNMLLDVVRKLSERYQNNGIYAIPHDRSHYNGDYSLITVDDAEKPTGVVLCHVEAAYLNIDYLASLRPGNPMVVASLLKQLCLKAGQLQEMDVHFHAINPGIDKLASSILGVYLRKTGVYRSMLLEL